MRSAIRSLAQGEGAWPLFVFGPVGTGKTSAALCLLDHTTGGRYWTVSELAEHVRAVAFDRVQYAPYGDSDPARAVLTLEKFWRQVEATALVVLDELGVRESPSPHVYDCVKRVLDLREGKPLACLSNRNLSDLERLYDDRIASRLAAGTVIELRGPDRRIRSGKTSKV